ncbi:hypothetical protein [Streptomyces sp. OE57]|uniref:hypothetical protein n=1 Tax=Streptomyces lacaronensis TaxID=3379885 RepID=UPI0039B7354C
MRYGASTEAGAQLVEVLPREEYEDLRLPGAVHLWLRDPGALEEVARQVWEWCEEQLRAWRTTAMQR